MAAKSPIRSVFTFALIMLLLLVPSQSTSMVSADCEEDLAQANEELVQVKKERDDYAQRLEDQTMVLIVVMFLLVGSYFFFYLSARRQRVYIIEVEKRLGVEIIPKRQPRRRRRG